MSTRSIQDCIMTPDAPDRILRLNTVLDRTGLSRATLYRKIQCGTFPRQIKLSTRCAGWRESAISEWMRNPMFYAVEDDGRSRSGGA
jgi:prophage regulatory protein